MSLIRKLTAFTVLTGLFILPTLATVSAQELTISEGATEPPEAVSNELSANIKAPATIRIDEGLIANGSESNDPTPETEPQYSWDFGDGNQKQGKQVVHFYQNPGRYNITLTIEDDGEKAISKQEVFAARKSIILITDDTIQAPESSRRLEGLQNFSEQNGVSLEIIQDSQSNSEFISEEVLAKMLLESVEKLRKIDQIIIWTQGNTGLNALSRVQQQITAEEKIDFSNKTLIVIKPAPSQTTQFQRTFQSLQPQHILVGNEATIYPFIESTSSDNAIERLNSGGYEFQVIDETTGKIGIFNFMSYFVNYLIDSGIPDNTIVLILLVPVIATVIAFTKQVIGISTFGIYTPTILTLTFWMLGLKFGLITFILVLIIGAITRNLLKKFRLLYIPKMAIVLTIVALTLFAILTITVALDLFDAKFLSFTIFPLLIMSTLTEKFVSIQTEKGIVAAILIMAKTILISAIALFFIGGEIDLYLFQFKWNFFRNLMLSYPETILLLVIFNIFLGRWTGLRLLEYIRFREVFRHIEE